MAYDSSHLITLGQYEELATQVKTEIETAIAALPVEKFLDQTKTAFVSSFSFSASTYPGATNPNLDGKPVMVLAVKGNDGSTSYSFLNMATLVDTYTSGNTKTLSISGYKITLKVSAVANNAITIQSDGLHVDTSGKADKVSNATANNLAALNSSGNLIDSGIAKSSVLLTSNIATDAEVTEVLTEIFGS